MGRPSKLTPELQKEICDYIGVDGLMDKDACLLAGISTASFCLWKKKGSEEGAPEVYSEFLEAIKEAEAGFKQKRLKNIRVAGDEGDWKANAWLLERKYPEQFGRRIEHAGKIDGPAPVYQLLPAKAKDNGDNDAKKDEGTD